MPASLNKLDDTSCRTYCTIMFNIAVCDLAANLLRDCSCDHFWGRLLEIYIAASLIPGKAMPNMEVLLEMVAQGEVEKWAFICRQFHRCCQATLDDGQVAEEILMDEPGSN